MEKIFIKCTDKNCNGRINVSFKEFDQIICCPICKTDILFLNATEFDCKKCNNKIVFPLNVGSPVVACSACSTKYKIKESNDLAVQPCSIPKEFCTPSYCGANSFKGLDKEVEIAKTAFERIKWKSSNNLGMKKIAFINGRDFYFSNLPPQFSIYPLKYIHGIHLSCNWALSQGHQPGKFTGPIYAFVKSGTLNMLINDYGLSEIWVSNEKLYNNLREIESFRSVSNKIKILT